MEDFADLPNRQIRIRFCGIRNALPGGGAPRAIASLVVSLGLGALTIVVEQARSTTSDSSETLRNADEVDSLAEELLLLVGVEVEGSKESLAVTRV